MKNKYTGLYKGVENHDLWRIRRKFNQLIDAYERIDDSFIKNDIKNEMVRLQKEYFGLNWKEKIVLFKQWVKVAII